MIARLQGLKKHYGARAVLDGFDLELPAGQVTALLGRNGEGKSTAVRILAGLDARSDGRAEVFGQDPERLHPRDRQRLALVADGLLVGAGKRIRDEIWLRRRLRGQAWNLSLEESLMQRFQLSPEMPVAGLSKGQAMRLQLALALAAAPELLLLDEPAAGLDLFGRRELMDAVFEALDVGSAAPGGPAVLIVSHLIEDVEKMADRVVFLHRGKSALAGPLEELRQGFRRVLVLGDPDRLDTAARGRPGLRSCLPHAVAGPQARLLTFDAYSQETLHALLEVAGGQVAEKHGMNLSEIFSEILGPDAALTETKP